MSPKNRVQSKAEDTPAKKRPDPLFKQVMLRAAHDAGLEAGPTELQIPQSSNSDMLLTIPRGTSLAGTTFDYFGPVDIIILEFKSANDPLDRANFMVQAARVNLWSALNPKVAEADVLNVIVSARFPREFLKQSAERGCTFVETPGHPWLWRAHYGWHDVAIVVCEMLPLEPRYVYWRLFAAPTTAAWRDTLRMLAKQANLELLEVALSISAKEFGKMIPELEEIYDQYSAEEQTEINAGLIEIIRLRLPKIARQNPEQVARLLVELTAEERIAGLKPEERIAGLKPEERIAGLKPEEREKLLDLLLEQNKPQK